MSDEKDEAPVVVLPDDPVRCTLLKAADIVDERWCQQALRSGDNVCALGAIAEAAGYHPLSSHIYCWPKNLAREAAERLQSTISRLVPGWNDSCGRTAKEVSAAMRKAAMKD